MSDHTRGYIEGLLKAQSIAESLQSSFLSTQYAVGQPMSSFSERFACGRVIEEVEKAIDLAGVVDMSPSETEKDKP